MNQAIFQVWCKGISDEMRLTPKPGVTMVQVRSDRAAFALVARRFKRFNSLHPCTRVTVAFVGFRA